MFFPPSKPGYRVPFPSRLAFLFGPSLRLYRPLPPPRSSGLDPAVYFHFQSIEEAAVGRQQHAVMLLSRITGTKVSFLTHISGGKSIILREIWLTLVVFHFMVHFLQKSLFFPYFDSFFGSFYSIFLGKIEGKLPFFELFNKISTRYCSLIGTGRSRVPFLVTPVLLCSFVSLSSVIRLHCNSDNRRFPPVVGYFYSSLNLPGPSLLSPFPLFFPIFCFLGAREGR